MSLTLHLALMKLPTMSLMPFKPFLLSRSEFLVRLFFFVSNIIFYILLSQFLIYYFSKCPNICIWQQGCRRKIQSLRQWYLRTVSRKRRHFIHDWRSHSPYKIHRRHLRGCISCARPRRFYHYSIAEC